LIAGRGGRGRHYVTAVSCDWVLRIRVKVSREKCDDTVIIIIIITDIIIRDNEKRTYVNRCCSFGGQKCD
jgi:hypothetical protein